MRQQLPTRTLALVFAAMALFACGGGGGGGGGGGSTSGGDGPIPPLASTGRWLTDAEGRVVLLHGVNDVAKISPFYPAAFGFGEDDAEFLVAEGFNSVRLGVDFRGLMPEPGQVDVSYIENLALTVDILTARGIFIMIDFHQDGFSPMFNGNGLPDWMAYSDGLPNPKDAVFPLYYVQNPAMQRAFESFWANREGPNGIGLQDYYIQGVERVVERFADNEWVIGTELMNEPWSGSVWAPCIEPGRGCADLEQQLLVPFYERGAAAAKRIAPDQLVFVEPFVLFNFGQGPTSLPGSAPGTVLSFHSYAIDVAGEEAVLEYGVQAAERDGAAAVVTEFGATADPVLITRLVTQMDAQLLPWMFWAYNGDVIEDFSQPAGDAALRSVEAFNALVRPYPVALAGTPTKIAFDPSTKEFLLEYDTTGPEGESYPAGLLSVVSIPKRQYPGGYEATVEGATVTSEAGAPLLTLRRESGASAVTLRVAP